MKKLIIFAIALLSLASCKEKFSGIDFIEPGNNIGNNKPNGQLYVDSQYIAATAPTFFPKMILIQDFSGVKCANCPSATASVDNISSSNPGKVASMLVFSLVDRGLSDSLNNSAIHSTFRTNDGNNLRNLLGGPNVLPEVAVNQKNFDLSQKRIVFDAHNLINNFNTELAVGISPANIIFLSKSYDPASNTIKASFSVQYGANVSDSDYISVALTEGNLIDYQDSAGNGVLNYVHNNVLRKYMYPMNGLRLTGLVPGKTYIISFNTAIPTSWNPNNMKIIAILHKQNAATNNFYVSQVNQTTVK